MNLSEHNINDYKPFIHIEDSDPMFFLGQIQKVENGICQVQIQRKAIFAFRDKNDRPFFFLGPKENNLSTIFISLQEAIRKLKSGDV